MENLHPEVLSALVAALVAVVWFLLQRKDAEQAGQIRTLFAKHDQDVQDLQNYKLHMAQNHYQKPEIDVKVQKIEEAIEKSIDKLGIKFDKLSEALLDHIAKEDARK